MDKILLKVRVNLWSSVNLQLLLTTRSLKGRLLPSSVHTFFPLHEWIKSPLLMSNLNLLSVASHPALWIVSFVPSVGLQPPFSGFTQRVPSSIRIPVSRKQRIDMKFRWPQNHIQNPKDFHNLLLWNPPESFLESAGLLQRVRWTSS